MLPGDIGFARTTGPMGILIRFGEWLKFRRSSVNHMFILDRQVGEDWYVIQATIRGVTDSMKLSDVAPGGKVWLKPCPDGVDRDRVLQFARSQVGLKYGWLTIAAIAIDILTWNWVPSFRAARHPSWICSALACESLRFGGWLHQWLDIYAVFPQEALKALN